tara:strand:+ start:125 stop:427 length:303 start_codon:yes stop_codon:yes gene_type:complete
MKQPKRLIIKKASSVTIPKRPVLPTDDYYEDVVLVGGPFDGHRVKIRQKQEIVKYESQKGIAQYNRVSVEDANGTTAIFYRFWIMTDVAAINKLLDNYRG